MTRRTRQMAVLAALVAVLAFAGNPAQAQVVKPFKIRGSGFAPNGLEVPAFVGGVDGPVAHTITAGQATHLGRHTGAGTEHTLTVAIDMTTGIISGTFQSGSPFVFTGANGDKLVCNYGHAPSPVGEYMLVPTGVPSQYVAYFFADFDVLPLQSTGKFAGVTGSWPMYAVTDSFYLEGPPLHATSFNISWEGEGHLTFPQGP